MANNEYRKLPTGIQAFNIIREEGYFLQAVRHTIKL